MNQIKLHAPASSANVGPGYDIFAITLKEPSDEFTITLNDTCKITISVTGNSQDIPLRVHDNTAGLAAMELFKRKNITKGVHIDIHKLTPTACGLGTSGSAAAATIYGLNKLLNLGLSINEQVDIARMGEVASGGSPHADNVAASLLGGFILVKSYNPIDILKLNIPEYPVVIASIQKSQRSTRGFITYEIGADKLKDQMARCARVIHALHTKDIEEFGKAISQDYIAEPVRGAAIPEYIETKKAVLDAGAYGCTISGGGSSVIAFCSKEKQEEIAQIFEKSFVTNRHYLNTIKSFTCNKGIQEI